MEIKSVEILGLEKSPHVVTDYEVGHSSCVKIQESSDRLNTNRGIYIKFEDGETAKFVGFKYVAIYK